MSEENKDVEDKVVATPPAPVDGSNEALISQMEYLASQDATFRESQEYKDLIALKSGQAKPASSNEEDEEEDYEEEEENNEEEEEIEDVFGLNKKGRKAKEIKINFDVPAEMKTLVKSQFGIDNPEKFFEVAQGWRKQAQEKAEVEKNYTAILEDLQTMPVEIKNVVQAWAEGKDFTSFFQADKRLNYDDAFEKQDSNRLVQHYLTEEFDELQDDLDSGSLTQEEYDKQLRLLARTTKRFFNEEKAAIEKERERIETKEKGRFQALKQSATLSVESLTKKYPNFSKNELGKIRSTLVEGNIDSLFLNDDGTYNEEAAEKLAYALYGSKIVESATSKAKRQGETEANLKIVDSSAKTIRKQKSTQGNEAPDLSAIKHLTGMSTFKKDPYI
jgi:hypothetical protein